MSSQGRDTRSAQDRRRAGRRAGVHVCILTCVCGALLTVGVATVQAGFPLRVRLAGKLFFTPTGEPGRHGDLLVLGISDDDEVYLQVDDFSSANKERSQLAILRDMRHHEPNLRVINAAVLAPVLTEQHIQKPVRLSGFLYRRSGLLVILSVVLDGEDVTPDPLSQPKVHAW